MTLSTRSHTYLATVAARVAAAGPAATATRIEALVTQHERWRTQCLNLLPSENAISERARRLLDSTLATRLTEGLPGDKEFPPPRHNVEIDEVEASLVALARALIPARHLEWRATSNSMANAMALRVVTNPGDSILCQSMRSGGNLSYHPGGITDLLSLQVLEMPPASDGSIDLAAVRQLARDRRPKALVVGGSYIVFPLPVRELRAIADETGASLIYDAAHVGLLIAAGLFQDPLREGADLMTMGTHKIMGGPVGGLVFTDRDDLGARIVESSHPLFVQTRDLNKYASAAVALAELVAFGREYANDMVRNARALAAALAARDFAVVGADRGYTATHQVLVDVSRWGGAVVEDRCQAANILLHKARLLGSKPETDDRPGLRLSVQEVTRQGMGVEEMTRVAELIAKAVTGHDLDGVRTEVERLVAAFPHLHYCFASPQRSTLT